MSEKETPTEAYIASSAAVLTAANRIYEAALAIRAAKGLTKVDVTEYLTPALLQLNKAVVEVHKRTLAPAVTPRAPSIIQVGEDKTADFLRAFNSGANVKILNA